MDTRQEISVQLLDLFASENIEIVARLSSSSFDAIAAEQWLMALLDGCCWEMLWAFGWRKLGASMRTSCKRVIGEHEVVEC